jgi:hypothetical protein
MAKYHLIEDGVVVNFVEDPVPQELKDNGTAIPEQPGVGMQWRWDGAAFSPPILPFEVQKAQKQELLALAYADRIAAGYVHTDGFTYQLGPNKAGTTGIQDLNSIAAMVQAGAWPASGGFIRDATNVNRPKDAAEALDVAKGASQYVLAVRSNYWEKGDALTAASDEAALALVDITAGWP